MLVLTDAQIANLLADRKPISAAKMRKLKEQLKAKPNDRRELVQSVETRGQNGTIYHIGVRRKIDNDMDFSVRLSIYWRKRWINLVRCNGHHGPHNNHLERGTADGKIPANTCHIHQATERYQLAGRDAEYFAQPSNSYHSFSSAVEFLCTHFGCCDATSPSQLLLGIMD